jgi:hypothetical protein
MLDCKRNQLVVLPPRFLQFPQPCHPDAAEAGDLLVGFAELRQVTLDGLLALPQMHVKVEHFVLRIGRARCLQQAKQRQRCYTVLHRNASIALGNGSIDSRKPHADPGLHLI